MPALLDQKIYTALLDFDVVDKTTIDKAFSEAQAKQFSFSDYLLNKDILSDTNLGRVMAEIFEVPFVRLEDQTVTDDLLKIIPEPVAKRHHVVSYRYDEAGLHVAMDNPNNIQIIAFLGKKYGVPIKVHYATSHDIEQTSHAYTQDITETFKQLIKGYVSQARDQQTDNEPPIIELINTLFLHAYENNVSDIHIELQRQTTLIRFRIDGILHDIVRIPGELHERIISRLKVLAKLRTDEHQAALDGKIILDINSFRKQTTFAAQTKTRRQLDIRVSIVPVTDGEKVVLRLLSEGNRTYSLQNIGLAEADYEKIQVGRKNPNGLILVTGPTGSGKTTTLYSLLKTLNSREINIMTIEDPVEYDIVGINQIQVNPQTELTFAKGLRAIVRQDPDVVFVGEIRDHETAEIAVNSAMTGHLVLSSLHANDAATTIPRLIDLGIEPFLISTTTTLIVAQRLVRHICNHCRVSGQMDVTQLQKQIPKEMIMRVFGRLDAITTYQGKGCHVCHQTGYRGRLGIFEVILIDDQMRQAIIFKSSAAELNRLAIAQGMTSMMEDGLIKVRNGLTTIDEVVRVTRS